MIRRLHERKIFQRIVVSESEIDQFMNSQSAAQANNQEYRLGHILIAVPEAADAGQLEKAREKAERIMASLKTGADFAQTAIAESDGQKALEGGDLGWRKIGEVPSLFAAQVAAMKRGELAGPIRSPSGYHLIKVLDIRGGERHLVEETHARHILLKADDSTDDQRPAAILQELKTRIEQGEPFEKLAEKYSQDRGSAIRGGDLGWVKPGETAPEFEQAMRNLSAGQISEPFRTPFGWHIVQVIERREVDRTEEINRTRARKLLAQRKREEETENWLRRIREAAYVEYRLEN